MKKWFTTLALGLAVTASAQAQNWPAKPVTMIVPFPPGGSTDLIARTVAPKLQEKFGATFVIENKPGEQAEPVFSGWMFASSPALSAMEHPIYDVWVLSCEGD